MIWHSSSIDEVAAELQTDIENGLFSDEAERRLSVYGQNRSTIIKKKSFLDFFLSGLTDAASLILMIASVILFFAMVSLNAEGFMLPVVTILVIIAKCAVVAFFETYSEKSLDELKGLSVPTVTVRRNKGQREIPASELVPGDIIILGAGDYIPADARLVETYNFHCDESSLTEDKVPIEKIAGENQLDDITPIHKRTNMVFSGCSVISGSAVALVTATGNDTEARIHTKITNTDDTVRTPFIKQLSKWVKILTSIVFGLSGIAFLIGMIRVLVDRQSFSIDLLTVFSESISLAVAVSPKVILVGAVISLLIGIRKSVKNNILVNRLKSVERLGKIDFVCCHKTGLLTHAKTKVSVLFDGKEVTDLKSASSISNKAANLLTFAAVCSNGNITTERGKEIVEGNHTDAAIVGAAMKYLHHTKEDFETTCPRVAEVPFSAETRLMATVNMIEGRFFSIVKGAPEIITERCLEVNKDEIIKVTNEIGSKGNRVIAVAYKELAEMPIHIDTEEITSGLVFSGLIGFEDNLKDGTLEALESLKSSGVRTVLVTGDLLSTSLAAAKKMGIFSEGDLAITSDELKGLSDDELADKIDSIKVFGRVTAEDKERIVTVFKNKGYKVAVTGNSIGDAAVLKSADIGFALGENGTDVSKGAADMTLTNDSFSSLGFALYEGRAIFENVLRSIHYFISAAVSEAVAVILGFAILGLSPLSTAPILLISLLSAILPIIAINQEPPENAVKDSFNTNKKENEKKVFMTALWQGGLIGVLTVLSFAVGSKMFFGNLGAATALAFVTTILAQVFQLVNIRSTSKTFFNKDAFKNPTLFIAIGTTALIVALITLTPVSYVFGMSTISLMGWLISLLLALIPIIVTELIKISIPLIEEMKKYRNEK